LRALRQLRRESIDWREGDSLLRELSGGRRPIRAVSVSLHRALTGPMTFGVMRPVIVFPPDAVEWRTADLRRALRHELEHVRRADCLVDAVARVICALYWFHPLAWLSWHRLRLEAERACDDAVVRESGAVAYAEQLVSLAARMSTTPAPLLAMAGRGDLTRRVHAILDSAQARGHAGVGWTAAMMAVGAVAVGVVAPLSADEQARATSPVAFEVASVKENVSGDPFAGGDRTLIRLDPGGRFIARNASLRDLLLLAYRGEIGANQLAPLERWMTSRRFDVDARAAEGAVRALDRQAAASMDGMVQRLLEDRFKLRVRRESRPGDVYVLSIASGGPRLQRAETADACASGADSQRIKPLAGGMFPCHMFTRVGRRGFEAVAIDTTDLALVLRNIVSGPVEDRARVPMLFDASVHWNSDPLGGGGRGASLGAEPQPTEDDPDVPTALREQLGLKLDRERGAVETLVVEFAELATAN
jgi:uncharacterized protein (TIGR03435 family)